MQCFRFGVAMFVLLATAVSSEAAGLKIGVFAHPRGGDTYALVGTTLGAEIETYIAGKFPGAQFVGAQQLSAGFLETVDIVILNSVATFSSPIDPLDADEQEALMNFVLAGRGALIIADGAYDESPTADTLSGPFGAFASGIGVNTSAYAVNTPNPITDGPFGSLDSFVAGFLGVQSSFHTLPDFAIPVGRLNTTDEPPLAYIPENALAPGSGRVVLVADGDVMLYSLLSQDPLILNTIAYLVPEPDSLAMAGVGGLALAAILWARRRRGLGPSKNAA